MRKVNEFFFPLEEGEQLSISDGLWFYGMIGLIVFIGLVTVISTL